MYLFVLNMVLCKCYSGKGDKCIVARVNWPEHLTNLGLEKAVGISQIVSLNLLISRFRALFTVLNFTCYLL